MVVDDRGAEPENPGHSSAGPGMFEGDDRWYDSSDCPQWYEAHIHIG
ncbi:hypothetical protein ACFV4K_34605 [Nocardia sp. NPDC059764]